MSNSHYEGGGGRMPAPHRRMRDLLPNPDVPGASSPHHPPAWCVDGALICVDGQAGAAAQWLSGQQATNVQSDPLGEGLTKVTWDDGPGPVHAVRTLRENLGLREDQLSVDCIMVPAMMPAIGPATDPMPANPAWLTALQDPDNDVEVAVVDTGLYEPAGRLAKRVKTSDPEDPIERAADPGVIAYVGACHGGAIAGIVASRCRARVDVYNALVPGHTFMCDSSVLAALQRAKGKADAINMSWGAYRTDSHFPIATTAFVRNHPEILFVAAAGNDGTDHEWYPAALAGRDDVKHVASVGAFDTTGPGPAHVAHFSNFGDWVNAYAPGVDVITDYVSGLEFTQVDGTRSLMWGAAAWSGTSFAAPAVLAAIVAGQRKGETLPAAWERIRGDGTIRLT